MAENIQSPFTQPPPPIPPKSNLPMLYYGLVVVGTAAVILALYNFIIIKWCTQRHGQSTPEGPNNNPFIEMATSTMRSRSRSSIENLELLSSFKYKKEGLGQEDEQGGGGVVDYECAVCLSVFEDGEEVRKLPGCKHSFHASCIDMWLYSHSDCPLCRTPVPTGPRCHRHLTDTPEESSRENLLGSTIPI
ncbi:hypothetical protein FEM48_Zijuj08G0016800 [Ziziphus jujuba var. spinosa]|uniref:RING-type E3 ubiquitin transferase n=1 Tax=Ziziphus jujuba var. spinosa TaxID=714518 RepID=A0A978UW90_ZIZJJ|nr:hypothetical protein FEM48_Zijuj08G0016800 [Ziziphus jujuba var. spinosa]